MAKNFLIISLFLILPTSGLITDGNFQAFQALFYKQIKSPEFAKMQEKAEILLKQIHDRSAFENLLINLNNNSNINFNESHNINLNNNSNINFNTTELHPLI